MLCVVDVVVGGGAGDGRRGDGRGLTLGRTPLRFVRETSLLIIFILQI